MNNVTVRPAHYLVVHPERREFRAKGRAITATGELEWSGRVWADPRDRYNEDPFIWSEPWLFSYCKATGLRRIPRRRDYQVMAGSFIIFADKVSAKQRLLLIDTVFQVGTVHIWANGHPPLTLNATALGSYEQAFQRHLRFGIPGESNHKGLYTYSAFRVNSFGTRGSFIPISADGKRVSIDFGQLDTALADKLSLRLKNRLPPIDLNDDELSDLLRLTWAQTKFAIVQLEEVARNDTAKMTPSSAISNCRVRRRRKGS